MMKTGNQLPRLRVEPEWADTDGQDAAELMEVYANSLFPWQRLVLDCWLAKDAHGEYITTSAGLSSPRQNGKNACIEARELFGMTVNADRILHTAHETKTCRKSFYRLEALFTDDRYPELKAMVKDIRYTNGEEGITLKNGARIEFATRTRSAARGFDGVSLIVFDEAQELTDDQLDSIMATMAASATGNRQLIYTGTPPYPKCPGTVFSRIRNNSLTKPRPKDAWHEWSVAGDNVDDINTENVALWYEANPSLGFLLSEEYTSTEFAQQSKDGFARERLGWWVPALQHKEDLALDPAAWEACKSEAGKPEGKTAYGIKFSFDGSEVALSGAVIPPDGSPARISLIARKPTGAGTQWLADWLNERYSKASCVVIDGRNGVDVLVEKIAPVWRAKDCIIRPSTKQVLAAVSTLTDALSERSVSWYFGQEELSLSATTSVKRPISGGWGFGGDNAAPIESASLALWGAKTAKRDPNRKMKVG
jgi:hypothetical protein